MAAETVQEELGEKRGNGSLTLNASHPDSHKPVTVGVSAITLVGKLAEK